MAAITPVKPTIAGVANGSVAASAGGDTVTNPSGNVLVRVTNGSGASINLTIAAGANPTRPADGAFPAMTLGNQVVAVPAGATRIVGPIPPAFNDGNGNVALTYSAVTSVTVEALQV